MLRLSDSVSNSIWKFDSWPVNWASLSSFSDLKALVLSDASVLKSVFLVSSSAVNLLLRSFTSVLKSLPRFIYSAVNLALRSS